MSSRSVSLSGVLYPQYLEFLLLVHQDSDTVLVSNPPAPMKATPQFDSQFFAVSHRRIAHHLRCSISIRNSSNQSLLSIHNKIQLFCVGVCCFRVFLISFASDAFAKCVQETQVCVFEDHNLHTPLLHKTSSMEASTVLNFDWCPAAHVDGNAKMEMTETVRDTWMSRPQRATSLPSWRRHP